MYLEISGRQTGKSTRLISAIEAHLSKSPDNLACITAINYATGKHNIIEKINPLYRKRLNLANNFMNHLSWLRRHTKTEIDLDSEHLRFFWDEFDFIRDPNNVIPMANGYYCTTKRFTRTQEDWMDYHKDALLRLVVANNFYFVSHHGMKHIMKSGDLADRIKHMGVNAFNNEFMSGFDKAIPVQTPIEDHPNHNAPLEFILQEAIHKMAI